jgi:flagellar P-ring protein precursor FlgI
MARFVVRALCITFALLLFVTVAGARAAEDVRLKDLGRFLGWRDNQLVGYGIVTGLAGTGDSPRSRATRQALSNLLAQFDLVVAQDQLANRNVAAVMITATLPPSASVGDHVDVNVSSIGDARSLAGGTLLMAPLQGPDRQVYALAQGPVSVGGYRFDANGNLAQKNTPTAGLVPAGATVEAAVTAQVQDAQGGLNFVLKDADPVTAERVAARINGTPGLGTATARDAAVVHVDPPEPRQAMNSLIARLEQLRIAPDRRARVVVNERTGTVVAGGDVRISAVSIAHGDLRVSVVTEYTASQPAFITQAGDSGVRSIQLANSKLSVDEGQRQIAASFGDGTVADLVQALHRMKVGTRDIIAILQSVKSAGALYADLIVQ